MIYQLRGKTLCHDGIGGLLTGPPFRFDLFARGVGQPTKHMLEGIAVTVGLQGFDGLEIVDDLLIDTGMDHGWELAGALGLPALGPGPIGIIHVPIPRFRKHQPLCGWQAQRRNIADEHLQARESLATPANSEFTRLLDRIDRVATCIREPDHFGLGGLGLQQE